MLILSRKRNEQIVIGDGIVVTVVSVRRGNVRLGIEAPAGTPVHRREVYQSIQEEKGGAEPAGPAVSPGSV
jgi:carbon storage regulator